MVLTALAVAVPAGVALGVAAATRPRLAAIAVGAAGVVFTVPSLALFGLLVAPLGLGRTPAVAALALYSLLPVLRNTVAGLRAVPGDVLEAAAGMGMTAGQSRRRVALPLAAPVIVSGVRVAAVTSVGIATIASLVAAGGLGDLVFAGLRAGDRGRILAATLVVVALALTFDAGLAAAERRIGRRRWGAPGPAP